MEKFKTFSSTVVTLAMRDVDTDMIIPAQFLTTISRAGFADALFRRLRDQDPGFPLNSPSAIDSKILLTQSNFGCGSSREHAVWALRDFGFKVIIAESFADIFHGNALKNGLVLITLEKESIDLLVQASAAEGFSITVCLENQRLTCSNGTEYPFSFDSFRKHCILNGFDDLDYILSHQPAIDAHHLKDRERLFFLKR